MTVVEEPRMEGAVTGERHAAQAGVAAGTSSAASPQRASWLGDEAIVVSASGIVSGGHYAFPLVMLWLLPTREFSEVASISALLLVAGTIAAAAIPWVLAQEV